MHLNGGRDEEKLDSLFQAFRDACPAPEAGVNFMPDLWQKIEARQRVTFSFGRMASGFVTAALALSVALGIYLSTPKPSSAYFSQSYVEALDSNDDSGDLLEPVRFEVR